MLVMSIPQEFPWGVSAGILIVLLGTVGFLAYIFYIAYTEK